MDWRSNPLNGTLRTTHRLTFLTILVGQSATAAVRIPSSAFAVPGNATYDYIVVGGGTAGLAVATRLAASGASVGVVEAGGFYEVDNGNLSVVPGYAFSDPILAPVEMFPPMPLMDWSLLSQPQTGANNRKIHYAAGKTLGGTSAINTLACHRATKGAYQRWADLVGNSGYTWDNLLKYFVRSTTFTPPNWAKRNTPNATFSYDKSVFCTGSNCGPVQVSYANWVDPSNTWFALALQAIGLNMSSIGFNSGILSGGAYTTGTIDPEDATRSSSETGYLRLAIQSTQLMAHTRTQALKILFTGTKATGVSVNTAGVAYTLTANKEVIVSAGTFHSPQLLMVSGVGPKAALQSLGIPVISDLPGVGQNLHDQIFFSVQSGLKVPSRASALADAAQQPTYLQQYLSNASGPLSSSGGYIAFEKLPATSRAALSNRTQTLLSALPSDWPEIEYLAGSFAGSASTGVTTGDLSAAILSPFSRGNVTLTSASMTDAPLINMGWLSDPADAEMAVAAFKRLRQAWNSSAIAPAKVGTEITPGSAVQSDADILNYIKGAAIQIWHACGTCAMGTNAAAGAVVDYRGKVFGVDGLRVVDASVLPFALPGHPQATIYALAEKIADAILGN
ncbi:alcohol oxidase [Diplogelasinospora grovesii]|uniref:Alcohol oxidase n=1 Tax=Diplogelasinospora grovesii TaxID=303347 RepID=A0AAN6S3T2_9PEZI|nr:alcohol oxidase [Diplogelasinospora grovesii]